MSDNASIRRGPFTLTVTLPDSADEQDAAALCFAIGYIFNTTALSVGDHARGLGLEVDVQFLEGTPPEPWPIGSLVRTDQIQ